MTLGNGVVTTYSYNLANWVTSVFNTKSSGGIISSYSYEYYASGNQKSKTESTGAVTTYIYDDLGRLTQESESDGTILSYSYDAAGNRARLTATGIESYVIDYSYNAVNQLTSEVKTIGEETETTTYTYDGNGNTLTVNAPESLQVNTYNLFNQLTATNINGSSSAYVYNTAGIRTAKTVDNVTTVFLLDGGNVVAESQNGEITATYLRGANLISRETDTAELYYIFNAHGDVTALTNDAQTVTKSYDYDAFGNEKEPSTTDANPFRYCGEYFDKETGTYYLRARYYDPSIGRFTQQDTHWNVANMIYGDIPNKINESQDALGLKAYTYAPSIGSIMQSGNLYVYCVNNPIAFIDITGFYMRESAILYASSHFIIPNQQFYFYESDCANFVSQSLFAGGIEMTDSWYSYRNFNFLKFIFIPNIPIFTNNFRWDWSVSDVWSSASKQFLYFSDPKNGYINGDVIVINNIDDIEYWAKNGGIQAGDLLYFVAPGEELPHHATIISDISNGEIYFAAHTNPHIIAALSEYMKNEKIYIIKIKDNA